MLHQDVEDQLAKLLVEHISSARGLHLNPQEMESHMLYLPLDPTEARLDVLRCRTQVEAAA